MRQRFEALSPIFAAAEEEARADAAGRDPGAKIAESLAWSDAWLGQHLRRLAEDPGFAASEEARARRKADLHLRWRELHGSGA